MSQQTLEPITLSQLSLLPDSLTLHLLDLDDAVEQTRQLFSHTGSDAELLLKVRAMIAALHKLCPEVVAPGDR
jgi:hypothetical protein